MFTVGIDRPRNKTELNDNEEFKGLRNAVTNYLVAVRQKARRDEMAANPTQAFRLPEIEPSDLTRPTRAVFNTGPR